VLWRAHCTNAEEAEQGVTGLGVCVRDATGKPVAAFTTAVPTARLKKDATADYVKALKIAASSTETALRANR